jgi:hypothetical protein
MKKGILILACILLAGPSVSFLHAAQGGGSRAAFTRMNWIGARYVALAGAAEALTNDVYALYWNPAGLVGVLDRKNLTPEEVQKKAREGKIDNISEKDLLSFSEDARKGRVVEVGISGGFFDLERYAAFTGVAFKLGPGVMGIGAYSVFSLGIPTYDGLGSKTGEANYVAAVTHVSYGWSFGIVSMGATLKILYEDIGGYRYMGFGADIGARVQLLPFLSVALVAQDLGTGLFPLDDYAGVDKTYDVTYPVIRASVALQSDAGFTIAGSIIKKVDLEKISYGISLSYSPHETVALHLGMNDNNLTTGLTLAFGGYNLSYAFAIDRINYGYNHIVSMKMLF